MIVTVFRSRLRDDFERSVYDEHAGRMAAAARTMPGFGSLKTFTADDGERVTIVEFETLPDQQRWAQHAGHREAQHAGRQTYYATYTISVCEELRRTEWAV